MMTLQEDAIITEALRLSGVTGEKTMEMLDDLQCAHDDAEGLNEFIRNARNVADEFGLTFPEITT